MAKVSLEVIQANYEWLINAQNDYATQKANLAAIATDWA